MVEIHIATPNELRIESDGKTLRVTEPSTNGALLDQLRGMLHYPCFEGIGWDRTLRIPTAAGYIISTEPMQCGAVLSTILTPESILFFCKQALHILNIKVTCYVCIEISCVVTTVP